MIIVSYPAIGVTKARQVAKSIATLKVIEANYSNRDVRRNGGATCGVNH